MDVKQDLLRALKDEQEKLAKVAVPIVTISATFRKELSEKYPNLEHTAPDVVFSRAHYSMAKAVEEAAKKLGKTSWLSDPTNFVINHEGWGKIECTAGLGKLVARTRWLKWLKDQVDTVIRNKLPITAAIVRPLQELVKKTEQPIISLHYEAGNQLMKLGKTVIQAITDPHIRPQYLKGLPYDKVIYCVFDEKTKIAFFKEAERQNIIVKPETVVVTGPPVDPRICQIGTKQKRLTQGQPINLAVCTGGLGTNFAEIKEVLKQLGPLLKLPEKVRLFLYAGTHRDIRNYFEEFAGEQNMIIGDLENEAADLRILYEDNIVDANEKLIKFMISWAHGVITKPSGDLAYDAAAAGCFLLFMEPWGEWEENIQERFVKLRVGYDLRVWGTHQQLMNLWHRGLLNEAMERAFKLPKIFRSGAENIVKVQQGLI